MARDRNTKGNRSELKLLIRVGQVSVEVDVRSKAGLRVVGLIAVLVVVVPNPGLLDILSSLG